MKEKTLEGTLEIFIRTGCERTRGNGFTMTEIFKLKKERLLYFQKLHICPCLFLLEYNNKFKKSNINF